MKTGLRLIMVGVALVMLAAWPHSVPRAVVAQGDSEVTYDAPVKGSIDDQTFTQTWTFRPTSADRVTILVERLDGNLVPSVELLDANGSSVASSYGPDRTRSAALIEDFTLPAVTEYQIAVGRENGETGKTTGVYRLTVMLLALAAENPANTEVIGPVELGGSVSGEVSALHWRSLYTLDAEAGDVVRLVAQRTGGTLFPEVQILDANGSTMTSGYTERRGDVSVIDSYELPTSGEFTVLVMRSSGLDGNTVGEFDLSVELLGSGEESSRLKSAAPGVIDQYNTAVTGELTNAQWYQDWQFRTVAADTISIVVRRAPDYTAENRNTLQPYVVLLGAAGQEITRGYDYDTYSIAVIDHYTLQAPGTYTIRVVRDSDKYGETSGGYELTVYLEGAGVGSPSLADITGEVSAGTPVEGEITGLRWADSWTYTSPGGESIRVMATRTGGTLIPQVAIQDANGQVLNSTYYSETGDVAEITSYTFPTAGQYRIVVYRDGEQDGYTTGQYRLEVGPAAP